MTKTKIAFFELKKWEEKYLEDRLSKLKNVEYSFFSKAMNSSILKKVSDYNILVPFIYSKIDKDIIDSMSDLKYVTTMSTGYDHIDLAECKNRKIKTSNVPNYGENTVAEHTFALIFALSRRINESVDRVNSGSFSPDGLMGFDLKGKTIGVIGTGGIGKHVVKIAHSLEMNIVAYDIQKDKRITKKYKVKYCSLDELLTTSDIITLHAPYNESTHHMINKDNIELFKKSAYLINTARGALIETSALVNAIKQDKIAGAALDVLEQEAVIKEEKELLSDEFQDDIDLKTALENRFLIRDPRVIVTPHNAFNSREALERILDTTMDNIKAFLSNKHINKVKK
jgi:D-lactate dehydrogenase